MSATQNRKVSMVVESQDSKVVRVVWLDPQALASVSVWMDGKQLIKVDIPKEETK